MSKLPFHVLVWAKNYPKFFYIETSIFILLPSELTIRGGHCSPYTYPAAIRMIENDQIPLEVR